VCRQDSSGHGYGDGCAVTHSEGAFEGHSCAAAAKRSADDRQLVRPSFSRYLSCYFVLSLSVLIVACG
jgi:hypothetical protein